MTEFVVGAAPLTCTRLMAAVHSATAFHLSEDTRARVRQARSAVANILAGDVPVYGVNTGVGSQKDHRVDPVGGCGLQPAACARACDTGTRPNGGA